MYRLLYTSFYKTIFPLGGFLVKFFEIHNYDVLPAKLQKDSII